MIDRLKQHAKRLKREAFALYVAVRDPRTPWYAKVVVGAVVAHTFSPIDLIPDFIPILGYLDDLVIVPLGLGIAYLLVPREVWREHREELRKAEASEKAEEADEDDSRKAPKARR